jgi:hypothetical protein
MTIRNEEDDKHVKHSFVGGDIPERMELGRAAVMAERTGVEGYKEPSNNSPPDVTTYANPRQFPSATVTPPPPPPTLDPIELERRLVRKKRLIIFIVVVVSLLIVVATYFLGETPSEEA